MKNRILIRVDALPRWGLAHAVRISLLTAAVGARGEVDVLGDGDLAPFFPRARRLDGYAADPEGLIAATEATKPDLVLIDNPTFNAATWLSVAALPTKVAIVDDFGGGIRGDLIINGTALPEYHHYPAQRPFGRVLCGTDYALISPHFSGHTWRGQGSGALVIVVGSGERATRWALAIARAHTSFGKWRTISMVVGRSFTCFPELSRLCETAGISLDRNLPSAELAQKLSEAAVALVTGGMIVYECLALGVPTVIFPQEENLIREADWFAAQGTVVNLTYQGGEDIERVAAETIGLDEDRTKSAALAQRARQIVDGRGMERASAAIHELLGRESA